MGCQLSCHARQQNTLHGIGVSLTAAQDVGIFLSATHQVWNHMVDIAKDEEFQRLQQNRLPRSCVQRSLVLAW